MFEGEVDPAAGPAAARLRRLGVELRVVCPPGAVDVFEEAGAAVTPLQVGTGVGSLSALRRVLAEGVEVVHAHGLRAGLAATLARPGGLPLVLSWSDAVPTAGISALVARAVTRTVVPAAAAVLAATPELVAAASEFGARALFVPPVLPDPARLTRSPDQVREELALDARAPIVLARARLLEENRLDLLVEASARWRREGVAGHVVLVGAGPAYRDLVARATVARAPVTFAGERRAEASAEDERAGLEDLLAAATVAVVTDVRARPDFALRAARAGVPVVVPEDGVIGQLLGDGAIAVPAGEVGSLDETVRSLLAEPGARSVLAARARSQVATWPDAAGAAADLAALYERVSRATVTADTEPSDTPGGLR